jgi:hypothetical protein
MSTVVWANILLTIPFLSAFIAIPLWLTFRSPETSPDHAEARAYLRTRSAFAEAVTPPGRSRPGNTRARPGRGRPRHHRCLTGSADRKAGETSTVARAGAARAAAGR